MTDVPVNTEAAYPFFLIWTKGGPAPRKSHTSEDRAMREATRLARRYPDKRFFVLQAVQRLWVNENPDRQHAEISAPTPQQDAT